MRGLMILVAAAALGHAAPALADQSPTEFLLEEAARARPKARLVTAPQPPRRPAGLPAFVRGRLVCAVNVNRYLASRGIAGTGSGLALSFLRWGRPSGPVPGAVQVQRRRGGGHVKIVLGDGMCLNPSARAQDWRVVPCGGRAIAWRTA